MRRCFSPRSMLRGVREGVIGMRLAYHFGGKASRPVSYLLSCPGRAVHVRFPLGLRWPIGVYLFTDASGVIGGADTVCGVPCYAEFLFLGQNVRDNAAVLVRTLEFSLLVTVIQTGALGLLCGRSLNQRLAATTVFRTIFFPEVLGVERSLV